ncbi:PTS lactose/cellobiose transporter subunit IIA [Peribacillus loiseleuriae]|uniref:PTS lactose/cellobiose transporter subunit IIA n=1 Tax=Peribacillus loiseleuriae TaxID=1679170 RepID=UPI00381257EA
MNYEQIAFQIISLAGDSFSQMMEALKEAKAGHFEKAESIFKEADEQLNEAHKVQTEMIVHEAQGEKNEFSVLLIHAQDTLMNTILSSTLIKELIELHQIRKG